jgi:membrane carboxypeptidase/penicillin-binding protein
VADEPVRIELPGGDWEPSNHDGRYRGTIDVREALADSRNVPFVRIARWCGLEATARRIERTGLELPEAPPPSFVLGSVETTPLDLASAYTVLATPGRRFEARPLRRIEKPGGSTIAWFNPKKTKVVRASTAYLVRDALVGAVTRGTARVAAIDDVDVAAKTGTTRDAWFAGHAESLVTVVWIGLDGGGELGLSGASAAGPLWKRFMSAAVPARPKRPLPRPREIVERTIDTRTGLLVRSFGPRARSEIFRKSALPPRNRFWRADSEVPVVR